MDAEAGKASEWLVSLRRNRLPVNLPPDVTSYRPCVAAAMLNVSLAGLSRAIKRNNLPASGNGKARRIPRESLVALAELAARDVGPTTVNHDVVAVRGFFRWLVKAKRIGSNPLDSLTLLNATVDVCRARRELDTEELRRLFVAAP
jgi:hypothetical protein